MNGLRVQSYGLPECIEKTVERSGWKERKGKLPKGRGLGVACSHYVSGAANSIIRSDMPHSTVNIKIDRDGGVVVYTGASEIGQGSDTMMAQIAAEVLGCSLVPRAGRSRRYRPDSDRHRFLFEPRDIYGGKRHAARRTEVKKVIAAAAAKKMNCASESLVFRDDVVVKREVHVGTAAFRPSSRAERGGNGVRPSRRPDPTRVAATEAQRRRPERSDDLRRSRCRRDRFPRRAHGHRFLRASTRSPRRQAQRRGRRAHRRRTPIPPRSPRSASTKKLAKSPFTKSGPRTIAAAP